MEDISTAIRIAYKKLKSSVYFDKTQLILRDQIVLYENEGIDNKLAEIATYLLSQNQNDWKAFKEKLLSTVKATFLPKKLLPTKNQVIINDTPETVLVDTAQYYIDLSVEGQLLGVIWVIYIGSLLEQDMYENSYGNRLKSNLFNPETEHLTSSPYLYEPYFSQYESWRDNGLRKAKDTLKENSDVLIMTLDFKRFFYNVHIDKNNFDNFYSKYEETHGSCVWIKRINQFVFEVIKKYSSLFKEYKQYKRNFLPIGFYPSNILSNWCLTPFDDAIVNRWNPLYYGRYVDDIIIVDKIEKNSSIYKMALNNTLNQDRIINYYLCNCNSEKEEPCSCATARGLLIKDLSPKKQIEEETKETESEYYVNPIFLNSDKTKIMVQNGKVKVFYFKSGGTNSLLTCFQNSIAKNASEFRLMPQDEAVLQKDDYSEIYSLITTETVNKLRGVDGVQIDKFNLSKFLGKYLRIGGLITDKNESKFVKEILQIFDPYAIIENYTVWEKVIQILVTNNKFHMLEKFVKRIIFVISKTGAEGIIDQFDGVQNSLLKILHSALCRALSINWHPEIRQCINEINNAVRDVFRQDLFVSFDFTYENILLLRKAYCDSRMCDKYVLPAPIDALITSVDFQGLSDEFHFNLSCFWDFVEYANNLKLENIDYQLYPYSVTPQELSISLCLAQIKNEDKDGLLPTPKVLESINSLFRKFNYFDTPDVKNDSLENAHSTQFRKLSNEDYINSKSITSIVTRAGGYKKEEFRLAIANASLIHEDFIGVLTDKPNRSYERYRKVSRIVNEAIQEKADMLILPESYLPIEWLPQLTRICAKNQMAVVTGLEHIKSGKTVYNLTATILPYKEEEFSFAHVSFHTKVHYSPEEKRNIEGYGYKYLEGKSYELFDWNDLWFSVYCCFELASIQDRSLFQSYADLTIAVEWNSDVNYYSSIIESLSRDLHCYCAQVNSSDFGDSRITRPSKTETKDIVKTKGGKNSTALVDIINVSVLREFQRKKYELQKDDKSFKPTPPQFNREILEKKIKGTLWEYLNKDK